MASASTPPTILVCLFAWPQLQVPVLVVVVVVDVVGATMDDGVVVGDARISAISIETGAIEKTL